MNSLSNPGSKTSHMRKNGQRLIQLTNFYDTSLAIKYLIESKAATKDPSCNFSEHPADKRYSTSAIFSSKNTRTFGGNSTRARLQKTC